MLNLQINVPFIIEQKMPDCTLCNAFVVLQEETTNDYRLANLTEGVIRPPRFKSLDEVEHYISIRKNWTVIQEDLDYGFDSDNITKETER